MGLTIINLAEARSAALAERRELASLMTAIDEGLAEVRAQESVKAKVLEAASPTLFYGQAGGGEDAGYRRISAQGGPYMGWGRDLFPLAHDKMQRVAHYLYHTNPLAKRLVEYTVDYVCGEGMTVKATDAAVQQALDQFWNAPTNRMDQTVRDMVRELSMFGELLPICAANPLSGETRVGLTDPSHINGVEYATLEALPGRAVTQPRAVILHRIEGEREGRKLRVVQIDEDPFSETYGQRAGECFYWAINKPRAASRGFSDLFAPADWLDIYDQMLHTMATHAEMLARFIWDVTLKGMTADEIVKWLKDHGTPPAPNSVRAHNENVEWAAVSPQLGNYEMVAGAKAIRQMAITPWPEMMFSEGGDVNRATAVEQGGPALKMLTSRQLYVKFLLSDLLEYAIDAHITAGTLPEGVDRSFTLEMPELSVRDLQKASAALQTASQALATLVSEGLIDRETAVRALVLLLTQIGIEADPKEVLRKALEEKEARDLADYTRNPPPQELANDKQVPRRPSASSGLARDDSKGAYGE